MGDGNETVSQIEDNSRSSVDSSTSFTVPGVSEFASLHSGTAQSPPPWNRRLSMEDINYVERTYLFII